LTNPGNADGVWLGSPAADSLAVYSAAGTERMRIDSSGNVGIGTSSPATALDVVGTITSDGLTVSDGTETTSIPATADRVAFTGASLNYIQSAGALFLQPAGDLVFNGTGAEIMRLKSGRVGIGTSSPRAKLDIEGNMALDGGSATTSSTTQTAIDTYSASSFKGCKAVITCNDGTDTYVTELLIANTASAAVATEYGQVGTVSALATFDVDVSGGNVRILATAASATSTTYKVAKTLM